MPQFTSRRAVSEPPVCQGSAPTVPPANRREASSAKGLRQIFPGYFQCFNCERYESN